MMLQMAVFVMRFAPLAVFTAVGSALAQRGAGVIETYAWFVGGYYLGLLLLWVAMIGGGALVLGAGGAAPTSGGIAAAFPDRLATTSAEATYPALLQKLESFSVPNRIAGFVLPLGCAFNLIGSTCRLRKRRSCSCS